MGVCLHLERENYKNKTKQNKTKQNGLKRLSALCTWHLHGKGKFKKKRGGCLHLESENLKTEKRLHALCTWHLHEKWKLKRGGEAYKKYSHTHTPPHTHTPKTLHVMFVYNMCTCSTKHCIEMLLLTRKEWNQNIKVIKHSTPTWHF